jgi:hypothetical protein
MTFRSLGLMLLTPLALLGCAGMNDPCGPLAIHGDLYAYKMDNQNEQFCMINYTYVNRADRIAAPLIVTRILDGQGNTLGTDRVRFDQIDPQRNQEKRGGFVNCRAKVVEVVDSSYRPNGQSVCGVSRKKFYF